MKPSASELTGRLRRLSARLWNPGDARERRHRLHASLTGEEEWDPDQPQIRMSRAFAVMLVLHLVAVGGLFAFHVFGKDEQNAEQNAIRQAHAGALPPPARALPVSSAAPLPSSSGAPVAAIPPGTAPPRAEVVSENTPVDKNGVQYQVHVMLPGETKTLVAAKFRTSVKELEAANPGMELKPGAHITIPQQPQRVITAASGPGHGGAPPVAVIAATGAEDPGYREFAMKEGENPYQRDESAAEESIPAPRASVVSAKPTEHKPAKTTPSKSAEKPSSRASRDDDEDRPARSKSSQQTAAAKPKAAVSAGTRTHVVLKGDTVYNVSQRYGLTPNEVMRANGISDPSKLQLGRVLKITVRH
ncbi:MAG: LysM peptidoglycan-binding domain-containing protein [Verrucomicrobiota bacterium]